MNLGLSVATRVPMACPVTEVGAKPCTSQALQPSFGDRWLNVRSLYTFGSLGRFEGHFLTFLK
jgi:hypothetical protein